MDNAEGQAIMLEIPIYPIFVGVTEEQFKSVLKTSLIFSSSDIDKLQAEQLKDQPSIDVAFNRLVFGELYSLEQTILNAKSNGSDQSSETLVKQMEERVSMLKQIVKNILNIN